MNFRTIAFLDTTQFSGFLFTKYRDRWRSFTARQEYEGSPHRDTETILLRAPHEPKPENWQIDVDHFDQPVMSEWKAAKSLLNRIRNAASAAADGKAVELGKVMIVSLKPGGHVDWHVDEGEYADCHHRLHLAISTNPGAWLYSGPFTAQPRVGELIWINNRVLHCAANFGDWPRIHLIVDVRKPDA